MTKSKQEWELKFDIYWKHMWEKILKPEVIKETGEEMKKQQRHLFKEELGKVVEMIRASRKTILGYDPLPGSEYDKVNAVLDKLISDLQPKLRE